MSTADDRPFADPIGHLVSELQHALDPGRGGLSHNDWANALHRIVAPGPSVITGPTADLQLPIPLAAERHGAEPRGGVLEQGATAARMLLEGAEHYARVVLSRLFRYCGRCGWSREQPAVKVPH